MVKIKYLYIKSNYNLKNTPVEAYVEMDMENYAVRYLDFLEDGEMRYATEKEENGTFLPYEKFPEMKDLIDVEEIKEIKVIPKEEFEEIWRKLVENKKIKEEIMKNEKKLYVKDFLIWCLESATLNEYYEHIGEFVGKFEDLVEISMYLIRKGIVICYNKDSLLSTFEAEKFLSNEENWKEIPNHNELVLLEKPGFDYYNNKIYEVEIDNGIFPDFEIIKKEIK